MFKEGDVINVNPPKEYGEWSCLMFTEDAKPVHGNPLKYMGKARPVCQAYQDEPELGRNLFCHSCRHQCPQREYMVKYVGRFEPQEAQPQTAAKMVEKITKHSGAEGIGHLALKSTLTFHSKLFLRKSKEKRSIGQHKAKRKQRKKSIAARAVYCGAAGKKAQPHRNADHSCFYVFFFHTMCKTKNQYKHCGVKQYNHENFAYKHYSILLFSPSTAHS